MNFIFKSEVLNYFSTHSHIKNLIILLKNSIEPKMAYQICMY